MSRDQEFDIIVWGATGSTGRRVAHHLETRADDQGLRWAIGGRNAVRLKEVRAGLGSGRDIPIVIADSHDAKSLDALVARTRVVCSVVGPYAMFGSELLAACARSGTHYCDLAAEAHWIQKMIDAHQAEAEQRGARIVHACGMDSIPSDLGVFLLQQAAQERYGKPCSHVRMRVRFGGGGFSGGTAGCLIYGMENHDDPSIMASMKDPYSLNPAGMREGPEGPDKAISVKVEYDEDLDVWTRPFFMGPMNTKIVRRSNALMSYPYGKDFRYEEAMLVGGGPTGWVKAKSKALSFAGLIAAAALPPTRWLLKRYVLPKPGEGPSQEIRETSDWEVILIGRPVDGQIMRVRLTGEGDPGTESTSRMVTESAICLVEDADQIAVGGGSWTPASALGDLLFRRLTAHAGLDFEIDKQPEGEPTRV